MLQLLLGAFQVVLGGNDVVVQLHRRGIWVGHCLLGDLCLQLVSLRASRAVDGIGVDVMLVLQETDFIVQLVVRLGGGFLSVRLVVSCAKGAIVGV